MLRWPARATRAIFKLFEPLQDVDVFVEDVNEEPFYAALLRRVAPQGVRIVKVVGVGGKDAVIRAAMQHDFQKRPAVFLIDGDLPWVRGEDSIPFGVCRLSAYCIENLIIDEQGASQVLLEDAFLTREESSQVLAFGRWVRTIEEPLVKLFAAFAAVNACDEDYRTIRQGVGCLCCRTGRYTQLDLQKVRAATVSALKAAAKKAGIHRTSRIYVGALRRARSLKFALDVVSGKDYLLPLLEFELKRHGCRADRRSLKMRLAHNCSTTRLSPLEDALKSVPNSRVG